jgi:peroxiredoxin
MRPGWDPPAERTRYGGGGRPAGPDFELKDQHGTPVRLSGYRGKKNVVLVFYPLAFSGVCSGELAAMRDEFPRRRGMTSSC